VRVGQRDPDQHCGGRVRRRGQVGWVLLCATHDVLRSPSTLANVSRGDPRDAVGRWPTLRVNWFAAIGDFPHGCLCSGPGDAVQEPARGPFVFAGARATVVVELGPATRALIAIVGTGAAATPSGFQNSATNADLRL
jgi:hypothetical protein